MAVASTATTSANITVTVVGRSRFSIHVGRIRPHVLPSMSNTSVALSVFMIGLAQSEDLSSLDSDEWHYQIFTISCKTRVGNHTICHLEVHGRFDSFNAILVQSIDEFVRNNYTSNTVVRSDGPVDWLMTHAALVRGYLCLLFSDKVVDDGETPEEWGIQCDRSHVDGQLSRHLMSLMLGRLSMLLWDIVEAIRSISSNTNLTHRSEISASIVILYTGLMHAVQGLKSGNLHPIYVRVSLPPTYHNADVD